MDFLLILFGLTGALLSVACAQSRQYYFVNTPLTWREAQSVCRRNYTDLATIESTADVDDFLSTSSNNAGKAWIGLYDDKINSWKWSLNDSSFYGPGEYSFRDWEPGEPNNYYGQQYCVRFYGTASNSVGRWDDIGCMETIQFVCYNGTVGGSPSYVLSNFSLNWTEAQKFCRANYVDLASVRNQAETEIIKTLKGTITVWIGLYREKLWSDGSTSLFRNWAAGEPNELSGDQCVAGSFSDSGRWSDESCSLSLPFVCYKPKPQPFRVLTQDESSITLMWNKMNITSFVLQFNGTETNISAPDGDGPVTYTVSSLTAGTRYTFTLFYVFENIRNSRGQLSAVTAPRNAEGFAASAQDESSITLQWNKINNSTSFVLQYDVIETFIRAPDGDGPVNHTVSFLTAGTRYTFTLFSVLDVRSSGVSITAFTGTDCITTNGVVQCLDPCDTYTVLNDTWRSTENTVDYYSSMHCDRYISRSVWYRFYLGQTSAQIPEKCVAGNRCGTSVPLWINGTHPVQLNEIVTRNVFGSWYGSCFYFASNAIQIKLCYGYYVYKLQQPFGCNMAYCAEPQPFRVLTQDESSITLQWNKGDNITSFVLQFNGTETNISAPDADGPVNHTVTSLTAGTEYTFTLFSVFGNVRNSGEQLSAVTAPRNAEGLTKSGQDESSITLQWNKINNSTNFVLQFNGRETFIRRPDGDGPVIQTVSSLAAGTRYSFTLFSVFENVRSSGVSITAVTVPENAKGFRASEQDESSITLRWNKVGNTTSFVLQFNGTETFIGAPDGYGPVTYTVTSLTPRTNYTFTLFSVFENVRSSGVSIFAATGPNYVFGLDLKLELLEEMTKSEMEDALIELLRENNLPPHITLKIISSKP